MWRQVVRQVQDPQHSSVLTRERDREREPRCVCWPGSTDYRCELTKSFFCQKDDRVRHFQHFQLAEK